MLLHILPPLCIGQYWYIKLPGYFDRAVIGEIVVITENEICFRDGSLYIIAPHKNLIGKWEPNWFFKLLGYI